MGFEWVPDVLVQLNQYPDERFWGILIISAFDITFCVWLLSRNK